MTWKGKKDMMKAWLNKTWGNKHGRGPGILSKLKKKIITTFSVLLPFFLLIPPHFSPCSLLPMSRVRPTEAFEAESRPSIPAPALIGGSQKAPVRRDKRRLLAWDPGSDGANLAPCEREDPPRSHPGARAVPRACTSSLCRIAQSAHSECANPRKPLPCAEEKRM